MEKCLTKKSTSAAGLAKLLEKLKSRDSKEGGSSTDISDGVFDEDSDLVLQLRGELKKCREDLLNDEKIFADQQLDFDQVILFCVSSVFLISSIIIIYCDIIFIVIFFNLNALNHMFHSSNVLQILS